MLRKTEEKQCEKINNPKKKLWSIKLKKKKNFKSIIIAFQPSIDKKNIYRQINHGSWLQLILKITRVTDRKFIYFKDRMNEF